MNWYKAALRVLALCAITVNPWGGSLLAFEEPENGVHPRRIELIAQLLRTLAVDHGRQAIVTTHSPLFCDAVLKGARAKPADVGLFNVRREGRATAVRLFDAVGPLFSDREINKALAAGNEDGLFESLLLRGMLDEQLPLGRPLRRRSGSRTDSVATALSTRKRGTHEGQAGGAIGCWWSCAGPAGTRPLPEGHAALWESLPDLLIVAIDGNCETAAKKADCDPEHGPNHLFRTGS